MDSVCFSRALSSRTAARWRTTLLAAAAVVAVGLGAVGVGLALRPPPATSTAEQVFAAPDVRTVSGHIPTGGTARFGSPLGVYDFVKRQSITSLSREALQAISRPTMRFAEIEGLHAHARAIKERFPK